MMSEPTTTGKAEGIASDTTIAGMSRRQLLAVAGTAAAALAAADLAGPAEAATPAVDMLPFKVTVKGPVPNFFAIPGNPPTFSVQQSSTGQADLLGSFAWVDHHLPRVGVDGAPKAVTGSSSFTASNGDAIYVAWIGLIRPTATPGGGMSENAFFVTGGSGRFAGAAGSGVLIAVLDPVKGEVTFSYDGMVAVPKK
jgi:hypothetical protein